MGKDSIQLSKLDFYSKYVSRISFCINQTNGFTTLRCPTTEDLPKILHLYHDPEHCGINATTEMIRRDYTWKGMQNYIREYVSK